MFAWEATPFPVFPLQTFYMHTFLFVSLLTFHFLSFLLDNITTLVCFRAMQHGCRIHVERRDAVTSVVNHSRRLTRSWISFVTPLLVNILQLIFRPPLLVYLQLSLLGNFATSESKVAGDTLVIVVTERYLLGSHFLVATSFSSL